MGSNHENELYLLLVTDGIDKLTIVGEIEDAYVFMTRFCSSSLAQTQLSQMEHLQWEWQFEVINSC